MTRGRVLFAPRNISGQSTELAQAVRLFGYEGEVWSFGEPSFGFPTDRIIDDLRLLTDPAFRWQVLDEAVRQFDIFHFQYSRSLLKPLGVTVPELWDIPLLRSLGKKVFMHFRGSDVRLRSVHLEREPESYFRYADVVCDEPRILGRVAIARRFCNAMLVSTPGLLDYVPDAQWVPHAIDVRAWRAPRGEEPAVPVVAHIPSSRDTKGSDTIDRELRTLAAAGVCEYRPLSNIEHAEMPSVLRQVDMVVDSLGIGDYGLLSVEAMASGAIALCHVNETNRQRNPDVPVVEVTSSTLASVVRDLSLDSKHRRRLRAESSRWLARRHDHSEVGRLLADLYSQPAGEPSLSYPDWPRSDSRRRVEKLEAELERRRSATAESVVVGARSTAASLPSFVLDRLLARIRELEDSLASAGVEAPSGAHRPRIRLRRSSGPSRWRRVERGLRMFVYRHPALHRLAGRVRHTLRGALGWIRR